MNGVSQKILITGGAGYIGSLLCRRLLGAGHRLVVLDNLVFGRASVAALEGRTSFRLVRADLRDTDAVVEVVEAFAPDAIVHLAAMSNDPSAELDPELTRAINYRATVRLMAIARHAGVRRFILASSASIYGTRDLLEVTETLSPAPITIYAETKARSEESLREHFGDRCGVAVRSATVCGFSPRLRLDLTLNILTHQALTRGVIRVFGGAQERPNVHIEDLCRFYETVLAAPEDRVSGRSYNVVRSSATVLELAELVQAAVGQRCEIEMVDTVDHRSYRLSGIRAEKELGFIAERPLLQAVGDLVRAYAAGRVPLPEADCYRNVLWLKGRLQHFAPAVLNQGWVK